MTLRILHVLDHSIPLHSGYAFRTLAILREQQKLGWRTLQVTTPKQQQSSAEVEVVDGFTFMRTSSEKAATLVAQMRATAKRVRQAVREFGPDLIHAHSPVLTVLPSLYPAWSSGLPVVYEVRATWEDAAVDHGTAIAGGLRYRLSRAVETFALRRVDHVTTICAGLEREIVARGIAPGKVTVIPNAVDVEHFGHGAAPDGTLRDRLGVGHASIVGFIGSLYGYEGLDLLLDAMVVMTSTGTNVHAVVVGGGPEEDRLRRRTAELGLAGRVHFIGRVSHDDVQRYYETVDVLVYPRKKTRLTEIVTPLKPLEAMAQGKLVVASDVGGHRELISNGETGVLFAAGDTAALVGALRSVLTGAVDRDAMRAKAREFVLRERSWAGSVARYGHAYELALKAKGRRPE